MGVVYPAVSTVLFELSSRSYNFSLLLVPGVVSRTVFCLQLRFQGSGVFTDNWAMVLAATISASPLLVIVFLLLYEISSFLASVTGRSYVACFVLTASASDAVLLVCFGIFLSLSSLWFLPRCGKFLRCPDLPAQV